MKYLIKLTLIFIAVMGIIYSCKNSETANGGDAETPTSGKAVILVDNTIQPIVEDVLAVFHSVYDRANITQINKSENEIVNALLQDSAKVVVMPRLLTDEEEARFRKLKVTPVITHFATDAIALITNAKANDTVIDLEEIYKVLSGKKSDKVDRLVFDNANSSTIQYLLQQAGIAALPSGNVYSLKTNEEVIKYVHDTPGAVGIVGVNWLVQPPQTLVKYVNDLTILGVNNVKTGGAAKKYYKPTQSNIATGSYPLTRKLYVLNYSGYDGLGTGFANYIGAHEGQRIILKSGLLPVNIPSREIEVRNKL